MSQIFSELSLERPTLQRTSASCPESCLLEGEDGSPKGPRRVRRESMIVDSFFDEIEDNCIVLGRNEDSCAVLSVLSRLIDDPPGGTTESPDWDAILDILRQNPAASSLWRSRDGSHVSHRSVLHAAAARDAPPAVLSEIARLHPGSIRATNRRGHNPLHAACAAGAGMEAVAALLLEWPGAARCGGGLEGFTPLHLACGRAGGSEGTVRVLLEAWPGAAAVRDFSGCTPLKIATYKGAVEEVLKMLREAESSEE
mmetsp:Transcript_32975/g.65317  ORF Transcript_32975/g.65317 Transcript_32975/m.65317 type:complete len:255 (-) Transcript_32975:129-893(-)